MTTTMSVLPTLNPKIMVVAMEVGTEDRDLDAMVARVVVAAHRDKPHVKITEISIMVLTSLSLHVGQVLCITSPDSRPD